jgi:amino acid transporter
MSGMSITGRTVVTMLPYIFCTIAILYFGRSSDRMKERRWHTVIPIVVTAFGLGISVLGGGLSGTGDLRPLPGRYGPCRVAVLLEFAIRIAHGLRSCRRGWAHQLSRKSSVGSSDRTPWDSSKRAREALTPGCSFFAGCSLLAGLLAIFLKAPKPADH